MPTYKFDDLSAEQRKTLIAELTKLNKQDADGVPRGDANIIRIAAEITRIAKELKVDAAKVVTAIGSNLSPALQFRAYKPKEVSKQPRATRKK
jgi:hypothetical protein